MGGCVRVESDLGAGSRFSFYGAADHREGNAAMTENPTSPVTLQGVKVLIVETFNTGTYLQAGVDLFFTMVSKRAFDRCGCF